MITPEQDKLLAETEKLRAEAKDIARHPLARPSTWIPLLLAIGAGAGGLITGYYQYQVKKIEVAEATSAAELALLEAERKKVAADRDVLKLEQTNWSLTSENKILANELELKRQQAKEEEQTLAMLRAQIAAAQAQLAGASVTPGAVAAALTQLNSAAEGLATITSKTPKGSTYVVTGVPPSEVERMRKLLELEGSTIESVEPQQ